MSDHSTSTVTADVTADANASLFPYRLYEMLDECELQNKSHIVSWLPDGKAFKVHQVPVFVDLILPSYFRQSKYKSYQRQLNLWGFERITTSGPEKGAYYHKDFLKGQYDMVGLLTRQRGNKTEVSPNLPWKAMKPKSKVAKVTNVSKQQKIKNPTSFVPLMPPNKLRNAIVTPPISPRDLHISQTVCGTQHSTGQPDMKPSMNENSLFEGYEFFLMDEDAKYYELADVLLETGFLTVPGDGDDARTGSPTIAMSGMSGTSSTTCRV